MPVALAVRPQCHRPMWEWLLAQRKGRLKEKRAGTHKSAALRGIGVRWGGVTAGVVWGLERRLHFKH